MNFSRCCYCSIFIIFDHPFLPLFSIAVSKPLPLSLKGHDGIYEWHLSYESILLSLNFCSNVCKTAVPCTSNQRVKKIFNYQTCFKTMIQFWSYLYQWKLWNSKFSFICWKCFELLLLSLFSFLRTCFIRPYFPAPFTHEALAW